MMDDMIGALHAKSPLFLTRAQFVRSLEGCTFDPIYENGEMAVVFVVKGPEFHFAILADGFTAKKEHLARYPATLIDKYGYATTKTPKDDERQLRFNKRLGFVPVGEDEYDVHLRIERMRTRKEAPCLSSQ